MFVAFYHIIRHCLGHFIQYKIKSVVEASTFIFDTGGKTGRSSFSLIDPENVLLNNRFCKNFNQSFNASEFLKIFVFQIILFVTMNYAAQSFYTHTKSISNFKIGLIKLFCC